MSVIRGVLLMGRFRTQNELNEMSAGDQRNTLIVVLNSLSNQPVRHYQGLDDYALAGAGAVLAFLRETKARTDHELQAMSDEDQRNTAIVGIASQTGLGIQRLQGMSSMDLVLEGLGRTHSYIRGVLLAARFRTQDELNRMSHEDHRNTLIVGLSNLSNQPVRHYQSLNDAALAGSGAVLAFLREGKLRNDQELRAMSDQDQRNTLIVGVAFQNSLEIPQVQGLNNLDLVAEGLGKGHFPDLNLPDTASVQARWRFCGKCFSMFYNGYPNKGQCPAGGGHASTGFYFQLPHSRSESAAAQEEWRYCRKCHAMFYNGFPDKGRCQAGGGHDASGSLNFVLPHDIGGTAATAQSEWRYCANCHQMFFDGFPSKGVCPAGGGHQASGFNFDLPHDIRGPFVFTGQIHTGGLAALGGWVTLTINPDGTARWQGHAHNSGGDSYDFSISAVVRTPFGHAVAVAHSGHVGGLLGGSRSEDWDETYAGAAADFAHEFAWGQMETNLQYDSGIESTLTGLVEWAIKFPIGSALTPVGLVVFLGVELGSLISTGSLVPGARVVEGVLWMAGPGNTVFALMAAGIASLGSRTRDLSQEEYDWANHEVFQGALPAKDQLVLTDTIGPDSRAFTFPRFDGKITLNMGPDAFDDPRNKPGQAHGKVFIHELVHACQIQQSKVGVTLIADAIAARICEATGHNPYRYGPPDTPFTDLGLEAQAAVVGDWFSGETPQLNGHRSAPKDVTSPYFAYISGNVRTRNL